MEQERELKGGRVTQGVVLAGGTVRRPQCPASPFVHQVLLFLEEKGCGLAPRFLGIDEKNREILSFLPGETPDNIGLFSGEACDRAAGIIRQLHQVLSSFPGVGPGQTVCHFDLSPCNFRFLQGEPYGVIDWDAARIGDPMDDLAYAVWLWLDLGNPEADPARERERIRRFLDAYGAPEGQRKGFKERVLRQMDRVAASVFPDPEQTRATREWAESCKIWVAEHIRETAQ